MKNRIESILRT